MFPYVTRCIGVLIFCRTYVSANGDPCFNYMSLNDSTRLSSYESDGITEKPSDRLLTPGWYRNEHITEGDMMIICPNVTQCGTNFPVWINGTLPATSETFTLKACKNTFGICCGSTFDVRVKGCEGYNVYELVPMTTNSGRYCFYGPERCPPGETSATGFLPCSDQIDFYVYLQVVPSIPSHDLMSPNRLLTFTCDGVYSLYNELVFDIVWEIEGLEVKRQVNVAYANITTIGSLNQKEWEATGYKIGMNVKCAMRARAQVDGVPTQFTHSQRFFAGFQVLTPSLSVNGGMTGYALITSTVPVACANLSNGNMLPCIIRLEMFDFDEQASDLDSCQRNITQLEKRPATCGIEFNGWNWHSIYELPVTTFVDQSYRSEYTAVVKLRALANEIDPLWNDYIIPDIKVNVLKNTTNFDYQRFGRYCSAYNDPYIMSFDGAHSFLDSVGEFVLYRHQIKPYAVHILTKNDRSQTFSNCGVSIQAGADVFVIYGCDYPGKWIQKRFCTQETERLEVYDRYMGMHHEIHLPTGTRVTIYVNHDFLNVDIYISPSEWTNTEGLCGSFNGNLTDDFLDRSGDVVSQADYGKAWSVSPGESLFVEKSRTAKLEKQYYFCKCVDNNVGSDSPDFNQNTDCSWQEGTQLCPPLTWDAKACNTRQRRNADDTDDVIIDAPLDIIAYKPPPENTATWKNGWNETAAKDICTQAIMGMSSVQSCLKLTSAKSENSIDMCVNDIKISGQTKYLSGALESFQSVCSNEIRLNTSLWVSPSPGQKSPAEEIEALQCPGECEHGGQKRGSCNNGKCRCFTNFAGPDCSINLLSQPTLFPPSANNMCDNSKRYCRSMTFFGHNFIKDNNLTCRLQVSQVKNGVEVPDGESTVSAVIETFSSIRCPLPVDLRRRKRSTPSLQQYTNIKVSVTNNLQNYSNTIPIAIYDSRCIICSIQDDQIICIQKTDICVKENICYPLSSKQCSYTDDDDHSDRNGDDTSNLWIIGAVLGGLALIVVIIVILIKAYHKSKLQVQDPYMDSKYEDMNIYNKPPVSTKY